MTPPIRPTALVGLEVVDKIGELFGVRKIAVMEKETDVGEMWVLIEVVDATAVQTARAADEAADLVAFGKKEFGQVRAVLAGDAGDEGFFH